MEDNNTKDKLKESKALLDDAKLDIALTQKKAKLENEMAQARLASFEKEQVFNDAKEKYEEITTDPIAFAKKMAYNKLLVLFSEKHRIKAQIDELDHLDKKAKLKDKLEKDANKKQALYNKIQNAASGAKYTSKREGAKDPNKSVINAITKSSTTAEKLDKASSGILSTEVENTTDIRRMDKALFLEHGLEKLSGKKFFDSERMQKLRASLGKLVPDIVKTFVENKEKIIPYEADDSGINKPWAHHEKNHHGEKDFDPDEVITSPHPNPAHWTNKSGRIPKSEIQDEASGNTVIVLGKQLKTQNNILKLLKSMLKENVKQFKANQRTSASEEANEGKTADTAMSIKDKRPGTEMGQAKGDKGWLGMFKSTDGKAPNLKGVLGNIMAKFGKAGKFLMSLGAKFLLPLVTTPVGWAVLAGLAVGGLVFSYWDDIVSFMSDIFKSVKSTFSKVISKISGMFSSIGDTIKEILEFFNPIALAKTLAKAILPAKYYNAIADFFDSGNTNQEESTPKPVTIGMNDTKLDDMPKPTIKSRGNRGKKSPSIPSIKLNENSILRKDEMVSGALQKGMDNNISQGSGNWGKKSSDTNIVAPTVNNNSTNIRQEKTHDTDITNLNLNASAVISPNQNW